MSKFLCIHYIPYEMITVIVEAEDRFQAGDKFRKYLSELPGCHCTDQSIIRIVLIDSLKTVV